MLAISHAATALLVKRCFPEAPMVAILAAVELPAILGVVLDLASVERAGEYMPYSHSIASLLVIACAAWLLFGGLWRRRALGAALALGILLHLALDLGLHANELALAPFADVRVGLAAYANPPLGIVLAALHGVLCWLVFRGGKALLAVIVLLTMATLTLSLPLALELAVAASAVWYFSRARAAELEHPDRRLARAFA